MHVSWGRCQTLFDPNLKCISYLIIEFIYILLLLQIGAYDQQVWEKSLEKADLNVSLLLIQQWLDLFICEVPLNSSVLSFRV